MLASLMCLHSVAVIDVEDLRREHMKGRYCNLLKVGEAVAYETVGMPLTSVGNRASQLRSAFSSAIYRGEWERQKTLGKTMNGYHDPPLCEYLEALGAMNNAQLTLDDMLGAIVVLAISVIVGGIFSFLAKKDAVDQAANVIAGSFKRTSSNQASMSGQHDDDGGNARYRA